MKAPPERMNAGEATTDCGLKYPWGLGSKVILTTSPIDAAVRFRSRWHGLGGPEKIAEKGGTEGRRAVLLIAPREGGRSHAGTAWSGYSDLSTAVGHC